MTSPRSHHCGSRLISVGLLLLMTCRPWTGWAQEGLEPVTEPGTEPPGKLEAAPATAPSDEMPPGSSPASGGGLHLEPDTERILLILPDEHAEGERATAIRLEHVRELLPQYLRLPMVGTAFLDWNAPGVQERIRAEYTPDPREATCGEAYQGDFFGRELARVALELQQGSVSEDPIKALDGLIAHFHCQGGTTALTTEALRQVFLFQGLYYYQNADNAGRDQLRFQSAYLLGTRDLLGHGLKEQLVDEDSGLWEMYTRAVRHFQRLHSRRVPVHFDPRRLPARAVFVDGEPLVPEALERRPVALYPGLHFLQVQDMQGRMRSATFEVRDGQARQDVVLGTDDLFPPRFEEAALLLRRALNAADVVLPDWLRRGLTALLTGNRLRALFVTAVETGLEADDALAVALFDAQGRLIDVDKPLRGPRYWPMSVREETPEGFQYVPFPLVLGVGGANLGGWGFGSIEGRWAIRTNSTLSAFAAAGFYHGGIDLDHTRGMGLVGGGVMREPDEPGLGLSYGVSINLLSAGPGTQTVDHPVPEGQEPEKGSSFPIALVPRIHLGVDWALQRHLYVGRGARYRRTPTMRLELVFSGVPDPGAFGLPGDTIAWWIEGRIQMRLWKRRSGAG